MGRRRWSYGLCHLCFWQVPGVHASLGGPFEILSEGSSERLKPVNGICRIRASGLNVQVPLFIAHQAFELSNCSCSGSALRLNLILPVLLVL